MYSSVLGMSLIRAITAGPLETAHVQMEKACENRKWQKLRHPDFTDCREKILRGPLKAFIECRAESSYKKYMCILPWVFYFDTVFFQREVWYFLQHHVCFCHSCRYSTETESHIWHWVSVGQKKTPFLFVSFPQSRYTQRNMSRICIHNLSSY